MTPKYICLLVTIVILCVSPSLGQSYSCDFGDRCDWITVHYKDGRRMMIVTMNISKGFADQNSGNYGVFNWSGPALVTPWVITDTGPFCVLSMAAFTKYTGDPEKCLVNIRLNGSLIGQIKPGHHRWRSSNVTLGRIGAPFYLTIGRSGNASPRCLVAVDNIAMINCSLDGMPDNAYCTFDEVNKTCSWHPGAYNKGTRTYWKRHRGPTPSQGIGPKSDHTKTNHEGFYMYVKVENPTKRITSLGELQAELDSGLFLPPPQETQKRSQSANDTMSNADFGSCQFTFVHHRHRPQDDVRLSLDVIYPCSDVPKRTELWSASVSPSYSDWHWERVSLTNITQPFILRFTARKDPAVHQKDFAVDDLSLSPQCFGVGISGYDRRLRIQNPEWANKLRHDKLVRSIPAQCEAYKNLYMPRSNILVGETLYTINPIISTVVGEHMNEPISQVWVSDEADLAIT